MGAALVARIAPAFLLEVPLAVPVAQIVPVSLLVVLPAVPVAQTAPASLLAVLLVVPVAQIVPVALLVQFLPLAPAYPLVQSRHLVPQVLHHRKPESNTFFVPFYLI